MNDDDEQAISRAKAITKRECGECSLCCRLLDVPEAGKPVKGWCQHAKPGKGCAIYPDRPHVCKGYACLWLITPPMPDYWRPLTSKMILDFSSPVHPEIEAMDLRVHLHPNHPNRWKEEPYYSELLYLANAGLEGRGGPFPFYYRTIIMKESEHLYIILSDTAIPWSPGVTIRKPNGHWDFVATRTDEDAIKLNRFLESLGSRRLRSDINARHPNAAGHDRATQAPESKTSNAGRHSPRQP